jgi:hypothetical protein
MTPADVATAHTVLDHDGHRPWPLHPQPLPGETLSSWLARTSALYSSITAADLLDGLGLDTSGVDLDRHTPEPVLSALAQRSTCTAERLREMTLAGPGCSTAPTPPSATSTPTSTSSLSYYRRVWRWQIDVDAHRPPAHGFPG